MTTRTPYLRVEIEGVDVTPWVSSVSAVEDDQQTDSVTITIPDSRMIYGNCLIEGSHASVFMGYAEPRENALIIKALITKVELSYPESGIPALTLKGEDRSIEMGLEERKERWDDSKAATVTALVKAVASRHKFANVQVELKPDPRITKKKPIHQDGKTDLAFLQDLAKTYQAKCFVELDAAGNEVLYFIPERRIVKRPGGTDVVLRYRMGPGSNLLSFSPTFDSSYIDRLKEKEDLDAKGKPIKSRDKPRPPVVVWPLEDQFTALANRADHDRIWELYEKGKAAKVALQDVLTKPKKSVGEVAFEQADIEAGNDVKESRRLGMSATGSTFGNIWLRAKANIEVQGVNKRFAGKWYVTNVTHKIDGGGFRSDFKCVR
ncbi:MAG: hypothetical protein AUI36_01620 [Cyanobacteria bacterium 13_1_40CM_2_61_4]|nr:MAG: hypothetical protein AUI36_01620 [Cyanobacteria bacterium 13_1_40CM_2_61_4]